MKITSGKFFRWGDPEGSHPEPLILQEDTELASGNFCLCRVVTNGHLLTVTGGNVNGLYVDGVKRDSFAICEFQPLPLAELLLATVVQYTGEDGKAAWLHGVEVILANQGMSYSEFVSEMAQWALAARNLVDYEFSYQIMTANFFPGMSWTEVCGVIRGYSLETWSGEATQVTKEIT